MLKSCSLPIAPLLQPDPALEGARCCAALWLPHTNGHFLAAYTVGTICVYKKVGMVVSHSFDCG
jgi:hypothetical protein